MRDIGQTGDGTTVHDVELKLESGARASIITYGATVRDLRFPLGGVLRRVVLGYPDLAGYLAERSPMGAMVGRNANRIAHGRFHLDGKSYSLPLNDSTGLHHIHGGPTGFAKQVWAVVEVGKSFVVLELTSPDRHEGYPGTVVVRCEYRLTEPSGLTMRLTARTDAPTLVNIAHHSYFTLATGSLSRDHWLQVDASHYTPVDSGKIPTGEIAPVDNTPYDFRTPQRISDRMGGQQLDINLVLRSARAGTPAARVWSPDRTVRMDILTTEPGLQIYDASNLRPSREGFLGRPHRPFDGLCLESQTFPDAINHSHFPSPILRPGHTYSQETSCRFSVEAPAMYGS